MANAKAASERVLGLDLIRLLSFAAIFLHHYTWVGWYTITNPFGQNLISHSWEGLSRALCFSGQTILMMSVFLLSFRPFQLRKRLRLLIFLLIGWLLFSLMLWGDSPFFMEWDIYPLIVLGLGIMTLCELWNSISVYLMGIAGFLILWISWWEWPSLNQLNLLWRHMLIGDCKADLAEWPILPWVGLIFCSYAAGYYFRAQKLKATTKMSYLEAGMWAFTLLYSFRYLGRFFEVPLGNAFSCFIFRRPFVEMFFHLVWIVFLMRLSFLDRVQTYLTHNPVTRWISGLAISRRFWLAYFIHYISLYVFVLPFSQFFLKHPQGVDLQLIIYPVLLEYMTRWSEALIIKMGKRYGQIRIAQA